MKRLASQPSAQSSSDHISFIDGAVTDLVHGYDSIISALPNVADRVKQMQAATEDMANTLETRMRHLVDGYENLDSISAQIPEGIRVYAAAHKNSLLEASQMLGPSYEQNYLIHNKELERLRSELQSIAHERVIVDVLTRQSIKKARKKNQTTVNSKKEEIKEKPFEPIIVPSYASYIAQQKKITNQNTSKTSNPKNVPQNVPGTFSRLSVRSPLSGSLMVPSMRHGTLAPEVANIKTIPTEGSMQRRRSDSRANKTCIISYPVHGLNMRII